MRTHLGRICFTLAALSVAACGGGSGSPATSGPMTLSGTVTKGPLKGETVVVYALDVRGERGAELGRSTAASDGAGSFAVNLAAAPSGAVQIEATGGTYASESDGMTVVQTTPCKAVLTTVGSDPVAVNPVTDLVAERALALLHSGEKTKLADAISQAKSDLDRSFHFSADLDHLAPSFDVAHLTGASEPVKLGLLLGALDQLAHRASSTDPDSLYGALNADFRDGRIDFDASVSSYGGLGMTARNDFPRSQKLADALLRAMHLSVGGVVNGVAPAAVEAFASKAANVSNRDVLPDLSARYTCDPGTTLVFVDGEPACWNGKVTDESGAPYVGSYYLCGNTAYASIDTCPDGTIPLFQSVTPPIFHASEIEVFVAQEVKPFTQAERDAMNDATMGAPLPSWAHEPLNDAQVGAVNDMYESLQGFYAQ